MNAWLISLALLASTASEAPAQQDSIRTDTLREVVVLPLRRLPIEGVIDEALKRKQQPHVPTVSDVLEKLSPGIMDKVMHPFAFKKRKRERRKRKQLETLEDYGKVKTFDEQLREAYEQQMREDSLENLKH